MQMYLLYQKITFQTKADKIEIRSQSCFFQLLVTRGYSDCIKPFKIFLTALTSLSFDFGSSISMNPAPSTTIQS